MDRETEALQEQTKPEARYANNFKVGFNAFEFLLDFSQLYPENGHGRTHTRIITSPVYAKALLRTLGESIEGFEKSFGHILEDTDEISDGRS